MRVKGGWSWAVFALACGAEPSAGSLAPAELTLLHTADVHSRLWPFRDRISSLDAALGLGTEGELLEVGGAARLATRLADERGRGAAAWLDSGDLLEGAPVFGRYRGKVEVELWGALGVAAMALGNHELSLDGAELERLLGTAKFPVLSANLVARSGRWLAPSATVFAGGVQLGVVGCGNDGSPPSITTNHNGWGLSAVDATASVQEAVDELAPRVAVIVVLSHLGLEGDRNLVRATTGVGLVLGGHQHTLTPAPEWEEDCASRELQRARGCSPRRVPIVHSGAYGRYLTKLELQLRSQAVQSVTLTHLPISPEVGEDFSTAAHLQPYRPAPESPVGYLPKALVRASALGGDSPLGNIVTDAILAETEADVVLLNSSGLRDDLERGPLLALDLELAFPFEEPWQLASLTGRELRAGLDRAARKSASRGCDSTLQVSGLWLRVHCAACREELTECWKAGRGETVLDDDERLMVALPQYLTLPGADFEEVRGRGTERPLSVGRAVRRWAAKAARLRDPRDCARDLELLSATRCAEAFGPWCPVEGPRARRVCSELPAIEGARDGRIQMLP